MKDRHGQELKANNVLADKDGCWYFLNLDEDLEYVEQLLKMKKLELIKGA